MLILAAVVAGGLCGCSTDGPLFANDATKAKVASNDPDRNNDVERDLANRNLSAAPQGSTLPRDLNNGALHQGNPYN